MLLSKDGKVLIRFFNSDIKPNGTFDIPANIDTIGNGMYVGCTHLETLIIPHGVTKIGLWGFSGCRNLRTLTLPTSITKISDNAFTNCKSLEVIIINSREQDQIARITALLPKDLRNKALGIELAQEVFHLRKVQLNDIINAPSRNPLFRFFHCNLSQIAKVSVENDADPSLEKDCPKLKDKVFKRMNRFLLNKNPNYQNAKNTILHEPLPHNENELATYEVNLKKIIASSNTSVQKRSKSIEYPEKENSNHYTFS
ncbi:leucine-rich repeat domain-containing protein [Legionella sp. D16C41]|uniref:leucine-rich repeat domain-containing protein n=1 Tax=Legionella sp. D16C41 TaxID=3402688 RepID=UPI003AF7E5D4